MQKNREGERGDKKEREREGETKRKRARAEETTWITLADAQDSSSRCGWCCCSSVVVVVVVADDYDAAWRPCSTPVVLTVLEHHLLLLLLGFVSFLSFYYFLFFSWFTLKNQKTLTLFLGGWFSWQSRSSRRGRSQPQTWLRRSLHVGVCVCVYL